MIAGYPFKYDNIMSSRYNLVIANIKTSSDYSDINGSMEYTTLNLPVNNKIMLLGKDLKEAYSFEMEILSDESNVALTLKQQKSIVNWLFEREYHKLEIISEEYKDIYFNCYLTQPQKIYGGCGVIGYKCKVVTDGLGAWENTKTKSFIEHAIENFNGTDINFSMPYTGKMNISVDGKTTEILNGTKTSTSQSTLKGVTKVIDSTDGLSNEFPIGQELHKIDSDTYDSADFKAGKITLNTEVKRLLGDNEWEYSSDSINTVSGTNLHITDAQPNEHFIGLNVNGVTTQDGTGDASPDNVRPIHGVTKITVNGVDYALPRELFTDDYYDPISAQGQANKVKVVINGTQTITYSTGGGTDSSKTAYFIIGNYVSSTSIILSSHFKPSTPGKVWTDDEEAMAIDATNGGIRLRILKCRMSGWSDSWTEEQKIAAFKSLIQANPVTVVYPLATPQPITGTPVSITATSDNTITTDNNGTISTTYINNSSVLYVRHPYSLQKIGLCNRFNYVTMDSNWSKQEEAITIYQNYMYIKILKTIASNIDNFNSWLNSTSVLYISPLSASNVIQISPIDTRYYNGKNHLTTDSNGYMRIVVYNNISENVFINTSDYNEYMIPKLTTIVCGNTGGNIAIENMDDVNSHQIIFTDLSPNEIITIDEFGQMQSSTGLNRYDNWNGKRLHLVSDSNHINISGDVIRLDISYQNVRRLGI